MYLTEIKQYLTGIKKIYVIDSENLRYKFVEDIQKQTNQFGKPTQKQHQQSWGLMFNYLEQFITPNNLILLCGNTQRLHINLMVNKKPGKSYSNVFTLQFDNIRSDKTIDNFTASDDLLFWLFAIAFNLIIGESCTSYQVQTGPKSDPKLTDNCLLHLITADKQKLSDPNVHPESGKLAKNFYTEFKEKYDEKGTIEFYINNNREVNIGNLIKLFLSKFIENPHEPIKYSQDPLGIKLITECKTKKCDLFEKFMSNIKTLQVKYFPPCVNPNPNPHIKQKISCALEGNLMTRFK